MGFGGRAKAPGALAALLAFLLLASTLSAGSAAAERSNGVLGGVGDPYAGGEVEGPEGRTSPVVYPPWDLVLNPPAGSVALTFDDGPHPAYTEQILDILDAHDAKATFFVLGERAALYPDLVAEIVDRGHSVQNHTYSHPMLTEVDDETFREEVRSATDAIVDAGAPAPRCLRPPYGDFLGDDGGVRVRGLAREEGGLELRTWHHDAEDWNMALTDEQVRQRAAALGSGQILLLHDGLDQSHRTVSVLPDILDDLEARRLTTEPICQSHIDFGFFDVRRHHPFFDEIEWMADSGISTGYREDNTYRPGLVVTRQAMAAFLWRLDGMPWPSEDAPSFSDVDRYTNPFAYAIRRLAETGIVTGYSDGRFGPAEPVSRQAMAVFLWRMAGRPDVAPGAPDFNDVHEGHQFGQAIAWMSATGISGGYGDGSFRPTAPITRQAMAAFLQRYAELPD